MSLTLWNCISGLWTISILLKAQAQMNTCFWQLCWSYDLICNKSYKTLKVCWKSRQMFKPSIWNRYTYRNFPSCCFDWIVVLRKWGGLLDVFLLDASQDPWVWQWELFIWLYLVFGYVNAHLKLQCFSLVLYAHLKHVIFYLFECFICRQYDPCGSTGGRSS